LDSPVELAWELQHPMNLTTVSELVFYVVLPDMRVPVVVHQTSPASPPGLRDGFPMVGLRWEGAGLSLLLQRPSRQTPLLLTTKHNRREPCQPPSHAQMWIGTW
jgi:hypothetical protein